MRWAASAIGQRAAPAALLCALLCAAPAFAQQHDGAAPSFLLTGPALSIDAPLIDDTRLGDITGQSWRGDVTSFGSASVGVAARDRAPRQRLGNDRMGGALPADVFRLSDPQLANGVDGQDVRLDLETSVFDTRAGQLDFQFGPRAGLASGPGERSASAGIVIRIGENLNQPREGRRTWFLFAGYGRKAVTIDPTASAFGLTDPQVQRHAIVGDAQAGLAFDLGGGADLALSYTSRERAFAKHGWGEGRRDGFAVVSVNIVN